MQRVVCISQRKIAATQPDPVLAQIVAEAQFKNKRLGLTGALVSTDKYFAQVLEGTSAAIDESIASLRGHSGHDELVVVHSSTITRRKFPDWKMAYQGPSTFVSRHVTRLLKPSSKSEQQRVAEWLTELVLELSSFSKN